MMKPSLIDDINQGKCSDEELMRYLTHSSPYVRANAVKSLLDRQHDSLALMRRIEGLIHDPQFDGIVMGAITVSHWTIGCLLGTGYEVCEMLASRLITEWPQKDKADLLSYLMSEKVWPRKG